MDGAKRSRLYRLCGVAVFLSAGGIAALGAPKEHPMQEPPASCEHDFRLVIREGPDSAVFTSVSVAGPTTNVVEFHDCQRLLEGASDAYGTRAGVYSSWKLDNLVDSLARLPVGTAVAAAEIVSWDGQYNPLFMRRYFNCLYVRLEERETRSRPAQWKAWMVPVGMNGAACQRPMRPDDNWSELRMEPVRHSLRRVQVPPVVRWEWSPNGRSQSIGIKCGEEWCIVANRSGFSHSPQHRDADWPTNHPRPRTTPSGPPSADQHARVLEIRGWYDEQRLAPPRGIGSRATGILASVFPDPQLGDYDSAAFRATPYLPAAYVVMPQGSSFAHREYRAKFNFDAGWNTIYLCMGDESQCAAGQNLNCPTLPADGRHFRWIARVVTQTDSTRHFCVTRREYPNSVTNLGIAGPGTARFRWKATDETVWMSCLNGCCEVDM